MKSRLIIIINNYFHLQHFPNLQKLDLGFMTNYRVHEYQQIMQRTLPYVLGIKSLTLSIEAFKLPAITLEHVARLPHLEELSLQFHHRNLFAKSPEHPKFDQQFDPSTFTKLRVLKISKYFVCTIAQFSKEVIESN